MSYTKLDREEFDRILVGIVGDANPGTLVSVAYEELSEYFNDEVLDIWSDIQWDAASDRVCADEELYQFEDWLLSPNHDADFYHWVANAPIGEVLVTALTEAESHAYEPGVD